MPIEVYNVKFYLFDLKFDGWFWFWISLATLEIGDFVGSLFEVERSRDLWHFDFLYLIGFYRWWKYKQSRCG